MVNLEGYFGGSQSPYGGSAAVIHSSTILNEPIGLPELYQ